ncbi:hypothetical protein MJO28_003667 [Puccinia striiformis f. sp. tritici]|uniref:Uncharacterized protein n=1 Tax=Puccinia striiformis f. sp. tritici TaxID=168172 RepID=A0ACC0ENV8_9BASI|nr:hypothetical protein Pst134EA_007704 [Puccinia striiformis f. sp. tritici]KAI9625032.1 hypothetical protein KEM48_008606 [Puccinia striiformis f. sp. tritici PST-130]KAH9460630.1 hypothetical protein Pst134EB_008795 [Puccinia striiformis f. sp. tritici]KAH9470452.1 hypothetical protein Pst134EA_007704 [Puccinia striiformis f. sp. tritici]KAI7956572.1 hypothetical protein MJO28_003667 [Puccinia striiformis f. sp. tritici]KAI7964216.1 hypothetical protein MJO29_004643 [Puccinia striiformis f.
MAPTAVQTKETYEEIRQRNIAANRSLLLSLQLSGPGHGTNLIPKTALKSVSVGGIGEADKESKSATTTKKKTRKSARRDSTGVDEVQEENPETTGRRRSGRISQLKQQTVTKRARENDESESESGDEYKGRDDEGSDEEIAVPGQGRKRKSNWRPPTEPKRPRGSLPPQRKAKSLKGNRPNPKVFGQQVGTEVGDWWDSRMMCSQAGVHAPPVCGISGNDGVGCYSVALSGGYEDDVDLGYAFTFTGSGGRALSGTPGNPKNLRTAPQSSDQEFTAVNASLRLSCELRNPVRVIRGYKNHSPFAPDEGYRYDGLYRVEKCWREAGQSGFQVCKFAFVRLPNQPRIPVKAGREAEAEGMFRDMGIQTDALPELAEERQVWTQQLAKQRKEEKKESQEDEPADEPKVAPLVTEIPLEAKPSPSPQNTNDASSLEPELSQPQETATATAVEDVIMAPVEPSEANEVVHPNDVGSEAVSVPAVIAGPDTSCTGNAGTKADNLASSADKATGDPATNTSGDPATDTTSDIPPAHNVDGHEPAVDELADDKDKNVPVITSDIQPTQLLASPSAPSTDIQAGGDKPTDEPVSNTVVDHHTDQQELVVDKIQGEPVTTSVADIAPPSCPKADQQVHLVDNVNDVENKDQTSGPAAIKDVADDAHTPALANEAPSTGTIAIGVDPQSTIVKEI